MSVTVTVGQPALTINRSSTFMVTDRSGEIDPNAVEGVFAEDTRFLSAYRMRINGKPWERISSAALSYHDARLYLTNPLLPGFAGSPDIPAAALALTLERSVDDGIRESYSITNYAPERVHAVFELELASDFADLFEVKAGRIQQRDNLVTEWHHATRELTTTYQRGGYVRRFTYQVETADRPPTYANGRLIFPIHLAPGATWHGAAHFDLHGEPERSLRAQAAKPPERIEEMHQRWLAICTRLTTPVVDLERTWQQAVDDVGALRLHEHDLGPDLWVPAAGVPWYVTLFGRDSLIASVQCMMVHARFVEGTLRTLATYQATERDDWRDAQPGKIVHELRHGELAHFDAVPHARYYGTWDATPLYLIALHQAWRWLGDRRLIEELRPTAERCLDWIDRYGDVDGDGFQEYLRASSAGYENMGWKDAEDAIVYPNGHQVRQPKALCELQGYVYAAKLALAELYEDVYGEPDRAAVLRREAAELRRRFNERFWLEDQGIYALSLDPEKQRVATVASNAGHCLWSGIADADKAGRVVQRLMAPDMWSGWGIRTLSADNPAYDPFSYQRGSVWPHDNGIIAAGMHRYGYHAAAHQVLRGLLDAASFFEGYQLPEVFAGLARESRSYPVQYRGADVPQAWAAGSVFQMVEAMLGLEADVPNGRLYLDPALPEWLPALTITGLKAGNVRLDIHFERDGKETSWQVLRRHGGDLDVCRGSRERGDLDR